MIFLSSSLSFSSVPPSHRLILLKRLDIFHFLEIKDLGSAANSKQLSDYKPHVLISVFLPLFVHKLE